MTVLTRCASQGVNPNGILVQNLHGYKGQVQFVPQYFYVPHARPGQSLLCVVSGAEDLACGTVAAYQFKLGLSI